MTQLLTTIGDAATDATGFAEDLTLKAFLVILVIVEAYAIRWLVRKLERERAQRESDYGRRNTADEATKGQIDEDQHSS